MSTGNAAICVSITELPVNVISEVVSLLDPGQLCSLFIFRPRHSLALPSSSLISPKVRITGLHLACCEGLMDLHP
jgi:hypothetical protein